MTPLAETDVLRTDLAPFLAARSAAVVGASDRGSTVKLVENLRVEGATLVGVHPTRSEAAGMPCVPSLAQLGAVPDLVCVMLGPATAAAAVEDALAAGARTFVIPGLGAEAQGPDGVAARADVARLLADHGAACVGVNCMGMVVPGGMSPWIGTILAMRPGAIGTVVHSGSIGEALTAMGPRVGIRCCVSAGSEISRDAADWLGLFAEDPGTTAAGLFLEAVRRPRAFEEGLRRMAEAGKPVVVLKVGRSDAAAANALAHTGAMVGSFRAFRAACAAYGAIVVDDYADWIEHLEALGSGRRPSGPRLVVLSNSGGEAELLADHAADAGIPLMPLPADLAAELDAAWPFHGVHNPVDFWAVGPADEIVPSCVLAAARHPDVDGVVINHDQSFRFEDGERETAAFDTAVAAQAVRETGTFCAVISTVTADASDEVLALAAPAGVPVLIGGGPALRALATLVRWEPRLRPDPGTWAQVDVPALAGAAGPLPERDSKEALAAYGVAGTRERRCATPAEAVSAADALGYPVVVKSDGPAHKERVGGVALGVLDAPAVRAAAERMGGSVLVAEELRGGVEAIVGLVRDDQFGPLVVVGVGGSWAEPLAATAASALAPLPLAAAEALVRSCAPLAARLGVEDVGALAAVVVAVGRLAADHPAVAEIDINPVRVHGGGAVALDALIVLGGGA